MLTSVGSINMALLTEGNEAKICSDLNATSHKIAFRIQQEEHSVYNARI